MPPSASSTEWRDLWEATKEARETLLRNGDAERFRRDLHKVTGLRITREIEKDPAEAARLRESRQQAREGKVVRRRGGTKSSTPETPKTT